MLFRGLVPLVLGLAVGGPGAAEVKSATPNGFEVATIVTIAAPADRVYAARWATSAAGGAPLTPSRAMLPTSASSCAPAAVFARH